MLEVVEGDELIPNTLQAAAVVAQRLLLMSYGIFPSLFGFSRSLACGYDVRGTQDIRKKQILAKR